MTILQRVLAVACGIALLLSASAFALLWLQPGMAEQQVRSTIVFMLKREMSERFGRKVGESDLGQAVENDLRSRIAEVRAEIEGPTPEIAAIIFAHLCEYQCGHPRDLASELRARLRTRLAGLDAGVVKIRAWAMSRYSDAVRELIAELRIFTGSNAALLLLAFIGLARRGTHGLVRVLAALLLSATLIGSYFYFANQNWLLTLILSDYVGWAYLAWVAALFTLLIDLVFLRARITNALVNGVLSLVS